MGAHMVVAKLNRHFGLQMEALHDRGGPPMRQDFNAGATRRRRHGANAPLPTCGVADGETRASRKEVRSVSDHFRIMHRSKQNLSTFSVGKAASLWANAERH